MEPVQDLTPSEKRKRRPWEKGFLAALSLTGNYTQAIAASQVSRQTVYNARENWPDFAADCEKACEAAADLLELEARRRAHDGVDEPVIYQGQLMGEWVMPDGSIVAKDTPGSRLIPLTVKKYSDGLLTTLLKAKKPKEYRDRPPEEPKAPNVNIHITVEQRRVELLGLVAALRERVGTGSGEGATNGQAGHGGPGVIP